jgi:crotonobetainyl-CoA:carnitine CoA-transferase CaiB-like acyl-CoA transferase
MGPGNQRDSGATTERWCPWYRACMGAAARSGFSYDAIKAIKPSFIYAQVSRFGKGSPSEK